MRPPALPCLRAACAAACAVSFMWPITSTANESYCYSIRDADRKNVCLATAKNQPSYCYSVQDSDTKNVCLAQVKAQRSYCYSVRNADLKNQCLAQVR